MATSTQTGQEVTCPLCEEYRGEPASVEAHISRKTDETHKGETGNQHREKLKPGDGLSTAESTASSSSESSSSESSSGERGAGPALPEPAEETDESSEKATQSDDAERITIPVPSKLDEDDAPESDESDAEVDESNEGGTPLVTVALLAFGGYIAFKIVTSRNASRSRMQGGPPGV